MKVNIYLDDIRPCPKGFILAKTMDEAINLVENNEVGIMSLDHDLGMIDGKLIPTGYDFVKYLCYEGVTCDEIYIHTDNPVGRDNMYETLKGCQRRDIISKDIKVYRYGYLANRLN